MLKRVLCALCLVAASAAAFAGGVESWNRQVKEAAQAQHKGDLKQAEKLLLKALLVTEGFDADDPRAAYTLDFLGTVYQQMGRGEDAIAVFERALKGFDRALGPRHEDTLASVGRLADAYEAEKHWDKSEPLRRRLLAEFNGQTNPDKAALAQAESDVALCLDAQKKWDEAMLLYGDVLRLRKEALGEQAPEVAETLSNEGRVWLLKGDASKAEDLLRQALAVDEKAFGPGDASVADDLHRLSTVLAKEGKDSEAKADEDRATAIEAAQHAAPEPTPQAAVPAPTRAGE